MKISSILRRVGMILNGHRRFKGWRYHATCCLDVYFKFILQRKYLSYRDLWNKSTTTCTIFTFMIIIYEQLLSQVNPLDRRSIMRVLILPTVLQGYHVVVFWWVLLLLIFCCYCCCCFMMIILGQNLVGSPLIRNPYNF